MKFKDITVDAREYSLEIFFVMKCCTEPVETGKMLCYLTVCIDEPFKGSCVLIGNLRDTECMSTFEVSSFTFRIKPHLQQKFYGSLPECELFTWLCYKVAYPDEA